MQIINCIAIDDEPPALRQMEEYISKVDYLHLLGSFDDPVASLSFLKNHQVDLIFLDIQMEGLTGMEFLRLLKKMPSVILTTAYDSYALQAFDLDVDDYLLKPISFTRFLKACEKIYNKIFKDRMAEDEALKAESDRQEYIFVKTDFRIQRVNLGDILYIEGMKEYLGIVLEDRKLLTLLSFGELLKLLPENDFLRVHKSYIVSLSKVDFIHKDRIHIGEKIIPIGGTFRRRLFGHIQPRDQL